MTPEARQQGPSTFGSTWIADSALQNCQMPSDQRRKLKDTPFKGPLQSILRNRLQAGRSRQPARLDSSTWRLMDPWRDGC